MGVRGEVREKSKRGRKRREEGSRSEGNGVSERREIWRIIKKGGRKTGE